MKKSNLNLISLVVIFVGIVLIISGIVTGKNGATIIGIIISGVATQQFFSTRSKKIMH